MVCQGTKKGRCWELGFRVHNALPIEIFIFYDCIVLLQEGDVIRSFDRVCEVQSDKATVEITSRYGGIVKIIHHEEGAIVKVREDVRIYCFCVLPSTVTLFQALLQIATFVSHIMESYISDESSKKFWLTLTLWRNFFSIFVYVCPSVLRCAVLFRWDRR